MEKSRLEILQDLVTASPTDSFARYGLAQEHLKQGDAEKALEHFQELLRFNPNYPAGYYHGGRTLERLGRLEEAGQLYRQGIEVTGRIGDQHARSELQAALDQMR